MTLNDLDVFVQVCDAGSLSAVARALQRTQPAVSQHVARLERELGLPLLERSTGGVAPTAAGRLLRTASREALAAIADGVRAIEEVREGEAGSLSITTGSTSVRHFLRDAVVHFRQRYPNVALSLHMARTTRECVDSLKRDRAELALVTLGEDTHGLDQQLVARLGLFLLVPLDDPLAGQARVAVADLGGERYIGLARGTTSRSYIERALAREGGDIPQGMRVDDFDTAALFVELGLGRTIVPALHAWRNARRGRLAAVAIDGLEALTVGWATRRWAALSRVAQAFVAILDAEMRALGPVPGLELP